MYASTPCKVPSSQYLVAMNHRKQQFITELQQALSDVQNQYSDAHNYVSILLLLKQRVHFPAIIFICMKSKIENVGSVVIYIFYCIQDIGQSSSVYTRSDPLSQSSFVLNNSFHPDFR